VLLLAGVLTVVARGNLWPQREPAVGMDGTSFTNSVGMKLVRLPAGSFLMGSPEGRGRLLADEKQHRVTLTRPFYVSATEVTQQQFRAVTGRSPSYFHQQGEERPVECVSWFDAVDFCEKLSAKAGRKYRLPTEAEWEYAGRAGSNAPYSFGSDEQRLDEFAWHGQNSGHETHPVAQKKPNAWGLYDLHGNVWEWCQDWYLEGYYEGSPEPDPPGPESGVGRVVRGGSWINDPLRTCRCSERNVYNPRTRIYFVGFRVVCEER
jgi:formylglycine-generating enzyme required for sulfatase activity